jgi:HD superfamily phosphohydrolase
LLDLIEGERNKSVASLAIVLYMFFMGEFRTQRLRDPVHGLIAFTQGNSVDELAWRLIDTAEFQRLRRIKQLGVSEFVYPGATHTRFAHCIGVFHTARKLSEIIRRELKQRNEVFNEDRAAVAVIAALLHDLGHGPLSHAFENVQKARGVKKKHEKWTAEIILQPGGEVRSVLDSFTAVDGFADKVAELLGSENPIDIYHAIVSSSFDADRLDYLQRDRLMTGTGAGAIDFDWLVEHVRVHDVSLDAAEQDEESELDVPTFCLARKALPAAEQFLLSRYTLHEQVYFHKTTRCIEAMITRLLSLVSKAIAERKSQADIGLSKGNPFFDFFSKSGDTVENYLRLDDVALFSAIEILTTSKIQEISDLAKRLRKRELYKTLDVASLNADSGAQRSKARQIDTLKSSRPEGAILKDEDASLSIYSHVGADDELAHKKLRILDGDGKAKEITSLSPMINELATKKPLVRYYFLNESDRAEAISSKAAAKGKRRET